MAKYKVYAEQNKIIWKDTIKADNVQEAIDIVLSMNYKSGLGMKYMDNLEANTIRFNVKKEEEE